MQIPIRAVRHLAASVAFATLAGGLALPLLATPAHAIQETATSRLQGQDRYGTAAAVATDTFPDGVDSVVLATGQKFADALAANGLAGALGAPILLTTTDALPAVTEKAITDLEPTTIYVMGGTAAVSQAVEDQLAEDYTIERVQGENRWETAAAAGTAIDDTDDGVPATTGDGLGSTSGGVTAVLANGLNFPDAVSAGPAAFAGRLPVLLTEAGTVPAATSAALEDLGIEHVLLIGGTTVINDTVKTALEDDGYTTERLAGNDRWATNVAVNEYATEELDFGGETAYLSNGSKFPDALSGGPVAGTNDAPLVLTAPTSLPTPARDYLAARGNAIDEVIAIGGTAAVSDATLAAAADAAQVPDNNAFAVTPTDDEIRTQSSSPLNSDGARTYTASGLEPGTRYVIALLDAETVDRGEPDTFDSYSVSDEASTSIESVNGSNVGNAGGVETVQTTGTARADGTITFVADATSHDSIIPVVYEDIDGNAQLTLSEAQADEPYGLGGRTTWVPPEAPSSSSAQVYDDITVLSASVEDGFFIAHVELDDGNPVSENPTADRTFFFDDVDRYRLTGGSITPSEFKSRLTTGDVLDVEYHRDLQSRFDIVQDTGSQVVGLFEGTTVSTNAGLEELNGGDSLMLHFSDDVLVSASASITVRGLDSRGARQDVTLTNGTSTSTWSVQGDAITIDIGRGADVSDLSYERGITVVDLTGVRDAAAGDTVPVGALSDTVLEDNGPELMPATSTCDPGEETCTIEFNEPVHSRDAQNPGRYDAQTKKNPETGAESDRPLVAVTLGSDGRTVTLRFGSSLEEGDRIKPVGPVGAVPDDDGQPSTQDFVVFV